MKCKSCGKETPRSYAGYCQSCYHYFRGGGKIYPIPPDGVVAKSHDGKVICHICGRAYSRLGSHVKESHGMSIAEYKEEFGLCNNAKTTEENYSQKMHKLALMHNMDEQLKRTGINTRVKKGQVDLRKGKPVRLQERIDKHNRMIKRVCV